MIVAIALLFTRIVKLFTRLKRAIETELAVRHAITELNELNDYMLRDLGIARGEIEHVVRRPDALTGRYTTTLKPFWKEWFGLTSFHSATLAGFSL